MESVVLYAEARFWDQHIARSLGMQLLLRRMHGIYSREVVFHEVERVASPGGDFEAVVLTGDAGATTRAATVVRIVRTGVKTDTGKPDDNELVLWASDVSNLVVRWKHPKVLDIQYGEASIDQFRNHEEIQRAQNAWDVIEVRLCPTNPDASLPSRGQSSPF